MFHKILPAVALVSILTLTNWAHADFVPVYSSLPYSQKTIGISDTLGELTLQQIFDSNGFTINGSTIDVTTDQSSVLRFITYDQAASSYFSVTLVDSQYTDPAHVYYLTDSNKVTPFYTEILDTSVDPNGTIKNFSVSPVGHLFPGQLYKTLQLLFDDDGGIPGRDYLDVSTLIFETDQGFVYAADFGSYHPTIGNPQDFDYNDAVALLSVPEPTSAALLIGCCGMLLVRSRRRPVF
ncbi:MAG TPA: hypothetical protein DCM28_13075 [Phycisphaerales bacterium]|nr:hypothetical protein [Phycisphaerales bacterium]HCD35055.1 hypothetical protein [Phycisphaerales bacterium]|tara:strand:+ start:1053 stop:1763 length:711 start_codon:yes stop_codon:yes gene_type:complete